MNDVLRFVLSDETIRNLSKAFDEYSAVADQNCLTQLQTQIKKSNTEDEDWRKNIEMIAAIEKETAFVFKSP